MTLDLREEFRLAVVQSFVDGYAAGTTPNPCMRCNGAFRFAALVEFSKRAGADILWTGHYARIVERDGLRLVARGADPAKDQSYMLATIDPALLDRVGFPLGEHDEGGGARRGRGRRPRVGTAPREPGGVLPRGRRLPLVSRAPRCRVDAGGDRRRDGEGARPSRGRLALHTGPAPRARPGLPRATPRRCARIPPRTHSSSARVARWARAASSRGAASTSPSSGPRRSSATARDRSAPP